MCNHHDQAERLVLLLQSHVSAPISFGFEWRNNGGITLYMQEGCRISSVQRCGPPGICDLHNDKIIGQIMRFGMEILPTWYNPSKITFSNEASASPYDNRSRCHPKSTTMCVPALSTKITASNRKGNKRSLMIPVLMKQRRLLRDLGASIRFILPLGLGTANLSPRGHSSGGGVNLQPNCICS